MSYFSANLVKSIFDPVGTVLDSFGSSPSSVVAVPVNAGGSAASTKTASMSSSDAASQNAIDTATADYLNKKALLAKKTSTIKTSGLGVASDVLRTGKKTLLGA